MILSDVNKDVYVPRGPKRVGRGCGSGHGKTSSRGHKGAGSRKSVSRRPGFQGGQKQLFRLVAKRGFNNKAYATVVVSLNVDQLQSVFAAGETVCPESLHDKGLVKKRFDAIKILGDGELTHKLTVKAHRFSRSAEEKIRAAGGTVELIG
jgi:large subunit ribosomal protein L15